MVRRVFLEFPETLTDHTLWATVTNTNGGRHIGRTFVVGLRVWDVLSKFRLRFGPLTYQEYRALMPTGNAFRPICQMTRFHAGPEYEFEIQAVLKADEVPFLQLDCESLMNFDVQIANFQCNLKLGTKFRCRPESNIKVVGEHLI